jgi:hypothetical protein
MFGKIHYEIKMITSRDQGKRVNTALQIQYEIYEVKHFDCPFEVYI